MSSLLRSQSQPICKLSLYTPSRPPSLSHTDSSTNTPCTMPPPVRSGKIASALDAFENTIKNNALSGNNTESGMYISNRVGAKHSKSNEAKRAAEKLKKRTGNMQSRRKDRPRPHPHKTSKNEGDKVSATLNVKRPSGRSRKSPDRSARSALTESTDELSLEDACDGSQGWDCSFHDSYNAFSDADVSTVGGDDEDFSLPDESSFVEPDLNPAKQQDMNSSWAAGFAVSYQNKMDSDSEEEKERPARSKKPGISMTARNRALQKPSSLRNMARSSSLRDLNSPKKPSTGDFEITYQHRAEETDSSFDRDDLRKRIRDKQNAGPGAFQTAQLHRVNSDRSLGRGKGAERGSSQILQVQQPAFFKFQRSHSSRSIGYGSEVESLNKSSNHSVNSRSMRKPSQKSNKEMKDNFQKKVIKDSNTSQTGFLDGDDDLFANHPEKLFDDHVFASASKPRPAAQRPKKKLGAAAAAENLADLPPAFRTIAKRQQNEKSRRSLRGHKPSSSRKLSEEKSADDFFDCV